MAVKPPAGLKHKPTVIAFPGSQARNQVAERHSSHGDAVRLADIIGPSQTKAPNVDRYRDVPKELRTARHDSAIASAHRDLSHIKDPVLRGLVKDVLDSWDGGAKADPEALVAALLGKKR